MESVQFGGHRIMCFIFADDVYLLALSHAGEVRSWVGSDYDEGHNLQVKGHGTSAEKKNRAMPAIMWQDCWNCVLQKLIYIYNYDI